MDDDWDVYLDGGNVTVPSNEVYYIFIALLVG